MEYIVKPLIGIDELKFGLTREEVKTKLGDPSNITIEKCEDGITDEIWDYYELSLELIFSEDDDLMLGTIEVTKDDVKINDQKIIGISEQELVDIFPKLDLGELQFDDVDKSFSSYSYHCDDSNISFWIQNKQVTSFWIMPEYDDSSEVVIWPK